MSDQEQEWFEVRTTIKVRGADDGDAIDRVAGMMRRGYKDGEGIYLVANFDARPTDDPINTASRRLRA